MQRERERVRFYEEVVEGEEDWVPYNEQPPLEPSAGA